MSLIDGGLARLFGAAFRGVYRPATLHRLTHVRARGGSTSEVVAEVPCRAQIERIDGADIRIRVLAGSLEGAITSDDRISIGDVACTIAGVERDPAGSYFELRGQRG